MNITDTSYTLSYASIDSLQTGTNELEYNKLIIPRGGEYTLKLSDGTEVILNSETNLKYPVLFAQNERKVYLEGEAFFNVKNSKETPFIVTINDVEVKVYGTSFNVSAYTNENDIKTTLVEGSVGVSYPNNKDKPEQKLKPGQQFCYNKNTGKFNLKTVNTDLYTAWTKGIFVFENEPLDNILKKLARWYNFEFEFKDNKLKYQRFTGDLRRYDDIKKILDMISIASQVKFKIENTKVIISNK